MTKSFSASYVPVTSLESVLSPYVKDPTVLDRIRGLDIDTPTVFFDDSNGSTKLLITKVVLNDKLIVYNFSSTHTPKSWSLYEYLSSWI